MTALIVYESMFGNTREIAEEVADALADFTEVQLVDVAQAPAHIGEEVGLLVVGGPTHAFGLSRPQTRQSARDKGGTGTNAVGLREWLGAVTVGRPGLAAAAFDTRIRRPRMPGSAARAARRRLRRLGFVPLGDAASFWVQGTAGPLAPGEVERARAWAGQLGRQLVAAGR